ncbi:MAG: diaminopimelate decarboxylase, partial [Halanaerobiales bacterium]
QTGQIDSKFGVSLADNQALKLIKDIINYDNLEITGIHAHIGSQIFALESYQKLIEVLFNFLDEIKEKTGKIIKKLDLGGGLGISHVEEENPPAISTFVQTISRKVLNEAEKHGYPLPELIVEPGRSIIGPAGTTLYTVGSIKQVPGMTQYVAVDGGMTDNIRPALYDADYEVFLANRCLEKPSTTVTVAGKCCESGDILAEGVEIPEPETGDILAITNTGAYTYAMASNYNSIPRPAVVLVHEGESNIIIKRESYSDLIENDIIPEKYQ